MEQNEFYVDNTHANIRPLDTVPADTQKALLQALEGSDQKHYPRVYGSQEDDEVRIIRHISALSYQINRDDIILNLVNKHDLPPFFVAWESKKKIWAPQPVRSFVNEQHGIVQYRKLMREHTVIMDPRHFHHLYTAKKPMQHEKVPKLPHPAKILLCKIIGCKY